MSRSNQDLPRFAPLAFALVFAVGAAIWLEAFEFAMQALVLVACWVAWAILGYKLGRRKGREHAGAKLGIFFGPFGLLVLLVLSDAREKCEECKNSLHAGATSCHSCGAVQSTRV
jgi:uncharacterized membrane protein